MAHYLRDERIGDAELSMGVADDKLSAADDRGPRAARERRERTFDEPAWRSLDLKSPKPRLS